MLYRWRWFAAMLVFVAPYVILRYAGIRLGVIGVALLTGVALSTEYIIRDYRSILLGEDEDDG